MSHGIMDSAEINEAFRNCHKIAGSERLVKKPASDPLKMSEF